MAHIRSFVPGDVGNRTYNNSSAAPRWGPRVKAARMGPPRRMECPLATNRGGGNFKPSSSPTSTATAATAAAAAAAAARGAMLTDNPILDGISLAYDKSARLPSDRRENMITVGGDLSEGLRMWGGEGNIRLGDIVHDDDVQPAYTISFTRRRGRGGKGRSKAQDGGSDALEREYEVILMDGWESDDDDAISLADGWAEMGSWRRADAAAAGA